MERTTRYIKLAYLPRWASSRHKNTPKNGPALGGYGAGVMKAALFKTMSDLPTELTRSLMADRGK